MAVASIHGRRCLLLARRSFSALPTRHSRYVPPHVCTSSTQLVDLTQELLQQKSLYTYEPEQEEDLWAAADGTLQKAEFVMRGHAARIPGTLWNTTSIEESPDGHIADMKAIIERLEKEGREYTEKRRLLRTGSHLMHQQNEDEQEFEEEEEELTDDTNALEFAAPGPTVDMFDTLLDSMAVSATEQTPTEMSEILQRVLERHSQDGGAEANTNPYTVPTLITFNAVLRGAANTPFSSTKVRDEALYAAFAVYDEMRFHVDRNSATYQYMLELVAKFIPASRTRGNISYGLWTQAKRAHVASRENLRALQKANEPSNGAEFDEWIKNTIDPDNMKNMPLDWRKFYKMRRYDRSDPTY